VELVDGPCMWRGQGLRQPLPKPTEVPGHGTAVACGTAFGQAASSLCVNANGSALSQAASGRRRRREARYATEEGAASSGIGLLWCVCK
jgi:hypothetical protein